MRNRGFAVLMALSLCTASPASHSSDGAAEAKLAAVGSVAYVQSFSYRSPRSGSYFLLTDHQHVELSGVQSTAAASAVSAGLDRLGFDGPEQRLIDADWVIVLRIGGTSDAHSIDDVLSGRVDPDARSPVGKRYVTVDAYDLPRFARFLQAEDGASEHSGEEFLAWKTVAVSHGMLDDLAVDLPALVSAVTNRLGSQMPAAATINLSR